MHILSLIHISNNSIRHIFNFYFFFFIYFIKINNQKRNKNNKDNDYDVVDSIMNQVYLDDDYLKDAWGEDYINNINKLREVVNETLSLIHI